MSPAEPLPAPPPLPVSGHAPPEISVVLPTFNRASDLDRAIASVRAQTFTGFELLIVDDGSSDGTFQVAAAHVRADPRVRYLHHANRKLGFSRNVGIQASVGRYLAFLDSDDTYRPGYLASRRTYCQSHPDVDLIQGGFVVEGNPNPEVVDYFDSTRRVSLYDCVVGPTFFGKREVFWALAGFQDIAYGEDTDFWARASQRFRVETVKSPVEYVKYETPDSITAEALRRQKAPL
jgi:glycosyltransferase involved in cell wall biosynthesis